MFSVLILAAGSSTRMGGVNKQLLSLGGQSVISWSVRAFLSLSMEKEILLVTKAGEEESLRKAIGEISGAETVKILPCGGETRQQSVENALEYLSPKSKMLAIHDGARPLVRLSDIMSTISACEEVGGAVLGVLSKDTVKLLNEDLVETTPERNRMFLAQTPQIFKTERYVEAMAEAKRRGYDCTDDAQLFEKWGKEVRAVIGHYDNIKITTPEDLEIAEVLLKRSGI